jgi:uncharacterized protein YbbC (DUF1343 family)
VTDRDVFRPVETGVAVLAACRTANSSRFAWREPPYEYESVTPPIDILYGSAALREGLTAGASAADLARSWQRDVEAFLPVRQQFLLY